MGGTIITEDHEPLPKVGVFSRHLGMAGMPRERHTDFLRSIEALGYGTVWLSEGFGREALTHASVALARTTTLRIATGIANVWARDATAMTNGARTLGDAFPGRFVLGVGIGSTRMVGPRGHAYGKPLATLRAYLEQMRQARWDGPEIEIPVPCLVGALGPKALELAAELTDGAHTYLVGTDHTAQARERLGSDAMLVPEQGVVLTDDPEAGRRAAREHMAFYLGMVNYQRSFARQGFEEADLQGGGSNRLVDAMVAWGDADAIARRVREHLDAGADQVAIQVLTTGQGTDVVATLQELAPALVPG